jgi:hypothetical protein
MSARIYTLNERNRGAAAKEKRSALEALDRAAEMFPETATPVPVAVADERFVVADLLEGYAKAADLAPLEVRDFHGPLQREVYAIAVDGTLDVTDLDAVAEELRRRGFVGDLLAWLQVARDATATRGRRALLASAQNITEMARRRRTIERLDRLSAGLRIGSHTSTEALAELRALIAPKEHA